MRILLIPSIYLPSVGGVELNTHELAKHLVARGHQVMVLTSNWRQWNLPVKETIEDIRVHRVPFYVFRGSFKSLIAFCCVFPVAATGTWLRIRAFRPHVVNVHFVGANALYARLGLLGAKTPLVVSLHGSEVTEGAAASKERFSATEATLTKRAVAALVRRAQVVTAVSNDLLENAAATYPSLPTRRRRIFMGGYKEAPANGAAVGGRFVLAVGRLTVQKGFDILLEAFQAVRRDAPSLRLIVIGGGPDGEKLAQLSETLGLSGLVTFTGVLTKAELRPYYRGCLFVVVPSRWEGLSTVIWEAFLHGKPVVATRVGGSPEIVMHEATGLLVAPEDPEQLARAILKLAERADLRDTYGRNAEAMAQTHANWNHIAEEYERVYIEASEVTR